MRSDAGQSKAMEASDAVAGHEPVMLNEVLDFLGPGPGKEFLDLTLGGGGAGQRCADGPGRFEPSA